MLAWIPPLAIAALIWWASSTPDLAITSGTWDTVLRKAAHIVVFGALALTSTLAVRAQRATRATALSVGSAIALLYAVVDEVHQTQVPTRHGSPVDVAIDAIGIGVVALVAVYRWRP